MYALIPTLIFVIIVILQALLGLWRGKRKSLILFVNFLIAFALSVVIYFALIKQFSAVGVVSSLKDAVGVTDGSTVSEVLLYYFMGNESSTDAMVGMFSTEVLVLYINMLLKLCLFFIIQIVVYRLIKFILYLVYLIGFRRRVREDNEEFGKGRMLGALIGSLRGVIVGFLVFSQFSTLIFIVTGGVSYTSDEYDKYVESDIFFEFDDIYKGLKTSRETGLGKIFESIKIGGTPIDYLFLDFVLSEDITNYNDQTIKYLGREELGYTVGVITTLYESGVISYSEGNIAFHPEKATPQVIDTVFGNISNLQTLTQVLPTLLLTYQDNFDDLPILVDKDMLGKIDFAGDIKGFAGIISTLVQMIDFSNFDDFSDFDIWDLDEDLVDALINDIAKITLLTQVAIPLGIDSLFSDFEDLVFDFSSIIWEEDIQNLTGLYATFKDLGLNFDLIGDMDYLTSLLEDPETVSKIDAIISKIFNSNFMYEVSTKFMLHQLNELSTSNDIVAALNFNLDDYSKVMLQEDVSLLLNTIVEGYSIYELLSDGDVTVSKLFEMDLGPLEDCLVGKFDENNVQIADGIMDLNILANADSDFYGSIFSMIPSFDELIGEVYISDWRTEFRTMFDTVGFIQDAGFDIDGLLEGDLTALSPVDDATTESLITSIQSSTVVSTMFVGLLTDTLSSVDVISIPDNIEWYGEGEELDSLLRTVFFFVNEGLISDFMSGDMTLITNCILSLTEEDLNLVCNSKVIHLTLSEQISNATSSTPLIIDSESYTDGYININELVLILDFVAANGISDFSSFDINSISLFTDENIAIINTSTILRKTIVNQLSGMEFISVPEELASYENKNWYGETGELNNVLVGIQTLFGDKTLSELSFEFDQIIDLVFASVVDGEYPMFESSVLRLTLSDLLLGLGGGAFLEVPSYVYENSFGSSMISKQELNSLLNAIDALGITNFNDFDISVFLSDSIDYTALFTSEILRATVSSSLTDIKTLSIPNNVIDNNGYITSVELTNLMDAIVSLGITDFGNFDVSVFFGNVNYDVLFTSEILRNTASNSISSTLTIPNAAKDKDGIITKEELVNLLNGLNKLGLGSFDTSSDGIYSTLNSSTISVAVESIILHHTISNQLASSLDHVVTQYGEEIVVVDGIVEKHEIVALITALETLGLNDLSQLSGLGASILDNIESEGDINTILDSSIMSAILSSLVTGIEGHSTTSQEVLGDKPNVNIYSKDSLKSILLLLLIN